ncbi:MAG: alpha/beta hydrolase [Solirubrobacteraceae bacterium]|nr:alpha/beta hydrolase [Solirubrobacteraceae bacterium]
MSEPRYALETAREQRGGLVERRFGPASPTSVRTRRVMRATIYPTVAAFRPTARGINFGRRALGAPSPPLRGTQLERTTLGGVPVEWTRSPRAIDVDPRQRVVLYIHGGGFVICSPATHRNLSSRISQVLSTPLVSVDYRMVPEGSIQTSQADALSAYRGLLDDGIPPEAIIVAGDSAGGNLAAHAVLTAQEQGLPAPAAMILLSPWVDLTTAAGSRQTNAKTESFIGGGVLDRIAKAIVPDAHERAHWRNSPINASPAQLAALPPTLIQVGDAEVLLDDGVEMGRRIGAAGGTVEVQTYEGQGHVVAMWRANPEAKRALREMAAWVREVFPDERDPEAPSDAVIADAVGQPSGPSGATGSLPA